MLHIEIFIEMVQDIHQHIFIQIWDIFRTPVLSVIRIEAVNMSADVEHGFQ